MSEVTRYDLVDISKNGERWSEIRETKHGNFIYLTDYQDAQAKIKELEFELNNKMESFGYKEMKARIEKLEQANRVMRGGIEKVIQMNLTEALHRYGKSEKAEDWSCVVVLRQALNQVKDILGE